MHQLTMRRLSVPRPHWGGLPVHEIKGSIRELTAALPDFVASPFAAQLGLSVGVNNRLLTVVRQPLKEEEKPMPVGVVSRKYRLVQHRDVLRIALEAMANTGIDPDEVTASAKLTEHGERMALSLLFPDDKDYSVHLDDKGDAMRLRVQCYNSVDGSMRFMALLGWYRFVCSNGLVVGTTRMDFRHPHTLTLDINGVGELLQTHLAGIEGERKRFTQWRQTPVTAERIAIWADRELRKTWGVKLAARAFHIAHTGRDGRTADPFESGSPSAKRMVSEKEVPGITPPCETAFAISQVLSWLAKERDDIQEQLDRMREIPVLMKALVSGQN